MGRLGVAATRTTFGRAVVAAFAVTILLTGPALGAPEDRAAPPPGTAPVYAAGQVLPVEGAWSLLVRTPSDLAMAVHAVGLTPGHAYAAWWLVFNAPEFCAHPIATFGARCGDSDLPANEGDPRIKTTMVYATGHVVETATGVQTTDFAASLPTGITSGTAFGPGLLDPAGAEVHLVLSDLGSVHSALDVYQLRALAESCLAGDRGDCAMTQVSVQVS
jgi:hypothetical protein